MERTCRPREIVRGRLGLDCHEQLSGGGCRHGGSDETHATIMTAAHVEERRRTVAWLIDAQKAAVFADHEEVADLTFEQVPVSD
jgi:hypothetical protein